MLLRPTRFSRLMMMATLCAVMILPWTTSTAHADIKEVTSQGGIKAWLVEDRTLPLITMNMAFDGGAALDAEGKEGLSSLLASLMNEGAGKLDSKAFQSALEDRSIKLGFAANEDALYGKVQMLTRESANAFALLRLALHEPRFDQEAIDRMRDALIAERQSGFSNPNWLASQALEHVAMADHPYGRAANGTLTSLRGLTHDDLVKAASLHFVKNHLKIVVVGDISPSALSTVLDQVFYDLPEAAAAPNLPPLEMKNSGTLTLVERDQPQTVVLAALPGLKRTDKDWFAGALMTYVLGGDFQSRLMSEIRIKKGLTYGISSALIPYSAGGVFYTLASTDNSKTKELLENVREQFVKMQKNGVTDDELKEAKKYMTGSFALHFGSSDEIADTLLEIQRLGLPTSYIYDRAKQINAVTTFDISRLSATMLKPDQLTIVAVGKPTGLQPTSTLTITP